MRHLFAIAVPFWVVTYALLVTFSSPLAFAADGDFIWVKGMGGTGAESGLAVAVDNSGNSYNVGTFNGSADFDMSAVTVGDTLTSFGSSDIYVAKFDATGAFAWVKQIGGTSADLCRSVSLDSGGNIYICGAFQGTCDFNPDSVATNNLVSAGLQDCFIVKLDNAGTHVWARHFGAGSNDVCHGIAVDGSGNVFTTGSFAGTVDFDPGVGIQNRVSAGGTDIFVSELNSSGNFVFAVRMGGGGSNNDQGIGIALDTSGNIYTTGSFSGANVDFDPGTGTMPLSSSGADAFISKLSSTGNGLMVKKLGGTGTDTGRAIKLDSVGSIYTVGDFSGLSFDPASAGTLFLDSTGGLDIFVCKLYSTGDFLWANRMGGTLADTGTSLAIESNDGHAYITGSFTGANADFGADILDATGATDVFVSKLGWDGAFTWTRRVGDTGADTAAGIAVDGSSSVYSVGTYNGSVDFEPGSLVAGDTITSAGAADSFLFKIDGASPLTPDSIPPSVSQFDSAVVQPSNSPNVDFSLIFSEGVLNTDTSDFSPINVLSGALSFISYSIAEAAGIYTLSVQGLSGTGSFQVDFAGSNNIVDGNANALLPTSSLPVSVDTDPPALNFSGTAFGCASGTVTATFSELVTGVDAGDFVFTNATAGIFTALSGTEYSMTFTASSSAVSVDMAGGVAFDTAGNGNTVATAFSYTADLNAPSVVLSTTAASGCAANIVTATFNEDVSGVNATDFIMPAATKGLFSIVDARTYTLAFTANTSPLTINMAAGAAQDLCGNNSTIAAQVSYAADLTIPSIVLSTTAASGCAANIVTATFNEDVSGVNATDFVMPAATKGLFSIVDARTYTLAFIANSSPVTIDMAAGAAMDICGNNSAIAAQANYTADLTAPTVVMTSAGGTQSGVFTATATFSKAVSGVTISDITVSAGTKGNFTSQSATVYTVEITPPFNAAGSISIDVAGGIAQDSCGNNNTAATQLMVPYDTLVPPIVIGTHPIGQSVIAGTNVAFSVADITGGTPPYTYEWFYVGTGTPLNLGGVLADTLIITGATQADNIGDYYCIVTDSTPGVALTSQSTIATLDVSSGVPVHEITGLGALMTMLAATGVLVLRRRRA